MEAANLERAFKQKRLQSRQSHQPVIHHFLILKHCAESPTHICCPCPALSSARSWRSLGAIMAREPWPKRCLHLWAFLGCTLLLSPCFLHITNVPVLALLWKRKGSGSPVWGWHLIQVSWPPGKRPDCGCCATERQLSHLKGMYLFGWLLVGFLQLLLTGLCGAEVGKVPM